MKIQQHDNLAERGLQSEFYVRCPFGLEKTVASELAEMGIKGARPLSGGVAFFGDVEMGYRACLWLRAASRVLLVLGRFSARNANELYEGARAIAWDTHLTSDSTFAVYARGTNDELRNTQFTALRVKDALCDCFVDLVGKRPNVATDRPDIRVELSLRGNKATLYLDLSGEPLHRREYRRSGVQGEAPLKENLAAGILLTSGWKPTNSWKPTNRGSNPRRFGSIQLGRPSPTLLFDPLCGSGTLVLEAACMTFDRAPGLTRDYWGFTGWLGHDRETWDNLLDEADRRFEAALVEGAGRGQAPSDRSGDVDAARRCHEAGNDKEGRDDGGWKADPGVGDEPAPIVFLGTDSDRRAIELARDGAKRLGLADFVHFEVAQLSEAGQVLERLVGELPQSGMVVANPPYGHRIGSEEQLPELYRDIDALLADLPSTWTLHLITPDPGLDKQLLRTPYQTETLYNGKIETLLHHYRLSDNVAHTLTVQNPDGGKDIRVEVLEAGTEQFVARLKKVARERKKWAKREGVSCYRIYDSDLPDYAVAIDRYEGLQNGIEQVYYCVAEYKAPKEIDEAKALRRYNDVLTVLPVVLGTDAEHVISKTREQARGGEQYAQSGGGSTSLVVRENGHTFLTDLSGHLDTGLFLDHRLTREVVERLAQGRSFLNLFAYTGTATVYAAAGGAAATTTVDLSNTYLEWAQKNMRLNGFLTDDIEMFRSRPGRSSDVGGEESSASLGVAGQIRNDKGVSSPSSEGRASHTFIRADVLEWLQAECLAGNIYDLIFVDPPTFSNSKRMDDRTWSVQRDHVGLLRGVTALLGDDGQAVFSCNLRSFKLDYEALDQVGISAEDITESTIPHDFGRNAKIHKCYIIRNKGR